MLHSRFTLNAIQNKGITEAPTVDLDQLGLPAKATIDPYTGKQLILKRRPRGWSVYAVRSNGTDDGGRFQKTADVGVGAHHDEVSSADE